MKTLINVDLSQAELRTMAVLSDDAWMIAALQADQDDFFDTHLMPVAYPTVPRAYFDIVDRNGNGKGITRWEHDAPVEHKEFRTKVKAVNYGLAFARGARAIAQDIKISTAEAQTIIDNYLSTAHNFAAWREQVKEAAITPSKRDFLTNPFGRRFQSEIITTRNFDKVQREALAFLPQSTSSDICLATAIRVHPQLVEWDYHIFNVVHDAIMIEGPEEDAETVGKYMVRELARTGLDVLGGKVPFLSEYSIGKSWSDLS